MPLTVSAALSDYGERLALGIPLGFSYTAPTWYLALSNSPYAEDGTGGSEVPTASGYARQAVTWGSASTAGGLTSCLNTNSLVFGPASVNYPVITNFGIFDAVTGGNLIWRGQFVSSFGVTAGHQATLAAGDFDVGFGETPVAVTVTFDAAFRRAWIEALLGVTAWPYSDLWIGFTGTGGGEPTDSGYSRKPTWGNWSTPATSAGVTTSHNTVQYQWSILDANDFGVPVWYTQASGGSGSGVIGLGGAGGGAEHVGDTVTIPSSAINLEMQ